MLATHESQLQREFAMTRSRDARHGATKVEMLEKCAANQTMFLAMTCLNIPTASQSNLKVFAKENKKGDFISRAGFAFSQLVAKCPLITNFRNGNKPKWRLGISISII